MCEGECHLESKDKPMRNMCLCGSAKRLSVKTLKDEWYVVIKAYKFNVLEILRDDIVGQV